MAPSRRKGANRAAAVAAARRKWKVGDLVLAKVKGFPAWPATISEPQKWGYPADWKKIVVFFFGTEQIAFCNPADVEEFTEEKKVSLLGKRSGKGADFLRAVKEIIDCFEKLKKQDQVSTANSIEETDITNGNNSEESLTEAAKDEVPVVTVKPLSTGTTNDLNSLTDAAVAAAAEDTLQHDETQLVEARSNLVPTEKPVSTTYSTRSKTDVSHSRNSGAQRRKSARRLRSSSRIDSSRLHSSMLPAIKNTRSSRRLAANALKDRSLRRSKRIMKSSDDSEGHDFDSPASVSNASTDESDSEMMSVDSDTHSINDDRTMDSGCNPVEPEPSIENNEGEAELNDRLDFNTNTVIIKKKRKPNRKRHANDTIAAAKVDVVASDNEVLKTESVSPSNNEKLTHKYLKDDGDEHLPLLKRARVRMGRPSLTGEEEVTLVRKEEDISEVPESFTIQSSEPLSCKVDTPADNISVPNGGCPANPSSLHVNPAKKPQFWETRKIFVDGEAALPPSKRLHRALEAMSANVAEDCETGSNCSSTVNIQSNCTSSLQKCSELSNGNNELGSRAVEDLSNGDALPSAPEFCVLSNMEMSGNDGKTLLVVTDCEKTSCSIDGTNTEFRKDSNEHVEGTDRKCLKMSRLNDDPAEIDAERHVKPDSPNIRESLTHLECKKQGLTVSPADHCKTECLVLNEAAKRSDPDVSPTHHCKTECSNLNEAAKISDPDTSQLDSDAILVENARGSLNIDTDFRTDKVDGGDDETRKTNHLPENNQDSRSVRLEFVEESRPVSTDLEVMLSVTPVKVLTSGHDRLTCSNDHLENRTASVTLSSSSLIDGTDSVARVSPPNSSICNMSAPENNNSVENISLSSPDVQLNLEKAKLAGKSSSKRESLSSFEAVIRSLTRTKESIGRATRIAIDSAKFGFATKVVEMLASNLESESSLHKKVDLFFLVDSITQCSRGMKGDCGVYPSAIQALLPRLLLAAAPPGSNSHENHRQCLKVLKVWQERKILPEPIIRHHIRELDALCGPYPTGGSRRPLRNERAFDDPVREMEGMLVDEYGSNSSIQLAGFCMPPMLRDDDKGSDSDGESFEAVTPEHTVENLDGEKTQTSAVEKRSHILEDVDGELEMEDVAPSFDVELASTSKISGAGGTQVSHHQTDNHCGPPFPPQQPKDVILTSVPLPRSPLPLPPPPPPPHPLPPSDFTPGVLNSVSNGPDTKLYSSSQNFNNVHKRSVSPRGKPRDAVHRRVHDDKDFEAQMPREMPSSSNSCSFNDRLTSNLSGRASTGTQPTDAFSKSFHLRPPHPSPSNQFSYVQEHRFQSRRDTPPPSHPNRFHSRNAENGNFYRDRDRNKFPPRDNIGEYWRPPFPSISGPSYHDGDRMAHAPVSYNGPPREPSLHNNRWNFPPRPMNHRHFNPYRPPSEGPISVANRGPSSIFK
ncbi:hypothetical protein BUALT_Bualt02G0222700 [Buddleja alternifolia]|uniref:HUA2-like protein 3 n=1 Tax=Buddleja alternifolia TaxID=168488 RepID=A0AAV6Y6K8_9LAMI|nr:hypothetical protein BUALT_Bualt02G0222700 [Buddleja alternifolia]